MNPKLLKRMARKPRTLRKKMVYYPTDNTVNNNIPLGKKVHTTSLVHIDGTIEVEYDDTKYLVFLKDLCEA